MLDNRTLIKLIRDKIKSQYKYANCCEICKTTEKLELHHYFTIFFLLEKFMKTHKEPSSDEERKLFREEFIAQYREELVNETVTLCEEHHTLLHKLYGSKPSLVTASKQKLWVVKQYNKIFNPSLVVSTGFGKFKV